MGDFLLIHLTYLGIFVILALSLQLINGFAGMFSLGHHGFFAVGAYAAGAFLFYGAPADPSGGVGVIFFILSLVIGVVAAAIFGFIVGVPCLRLRGDYLAIATLGFGEIARIVAQGTDAVGGARGLDGITYLLVDRAEDMGAYNALYAVITLVLCVFTYWFIRNLVRSRHGRALIAIREDEVAAELIGVNLTRAKVMAFVVGAAFAGLAGALLLNFQAAIEPKEFDLLKGIYILLIVVLGGLGSLSGTVAAAFVLYIVDKILLNLMPPEIQAWREVFFALMLVALMIYRPQGILGQREITETRAWKWVFRRGRAPKTEGGTP